MNQENSPAIRIPSLRIQSGIDSESQESQFLYRQKGGDWSCSYLMKNKFVKVALALFLLLFAIPPFSNAGEVRTWTAVDGRTLEAEFISANERNVTLRRKSDGKRFTLSLDKVSEEDRKWVAEALEDLDGPGEKEPSGIFEDRLTEDWEKMEYESLKFRFYSEKRMSPKKRHPIMIFLHGKGSGGSDNEKQLNGIVRNFAGGKFHKKNPSFIFAPQCPDDSKGWRGEYLDDVIGLLKTAIKNLPVDEDRIYITGVSMGGFGTWSALAEAPELFAAAVPVCGGGNPGTAKAIKDIPIWTHHGVADPVVSVEFTRRMVEALKKEKGNIKYTEYDEASGIKHDAWTPCYSNPEVYEWIYEQRKGKKDDK
ncbi:MAG: prolyl oligopeptidase family serine peptidase [Akkermansiaceae bacterium]|jgi:predicted esterase